GSGGCGLHGDSEEQRICRRTIDYCSTRLVDEAGGCRVAGGGVHILAAVVNAARNRGETGIPRDIHKCCEDAELQGGRLGLRDVLDQRLEIELAAYRDRAYRMAERVGGA